MKAYSFLMLLCLVALPMAQAAQYSNIVLQDSASNITLNISGVSINISSRAMGNGINLTTAEYNVTGATFGIASINLTSMNSYVSSWQFPNISSSSGNVIVILNGLSQDVSNLMITVGTNGIVPNSPLLTYPSLTSQNPMYSFDNSTGVATVTVSSLPSGSTALLLDAAGPIVSLTSPGDGSSNTGGTIGFTFTPLDANGIDNCSLLYGSGTVYTTVVGITNNASRTIAVSGIDSNHVLGGAPLTWQITCTDAFGNVGTSAVYSVVTATSSSGGGGGGGGSGGGGSGGGGFGGSGSAGNGTNASMNVSTQNASSNTTVTTLLNSSRTLTLTVEDADAQGRRNLIIVIVCVLFVVLMSFVVVGMMKR